jgi:hypothetical protein
MSTPISRPSTPSNSAGKSGFPFTWTGASRPSCATTPGRRALADHVTGPVGNHLQRPRARTLFLWAMLALLPAVVVATWFQLRVVRSLESQVTAREAFNLASRMDAVVAARTSAIRMAAGSLEVENLTASGGLNRLLSNLKELFPDFRSLEVFNEQGQPLAMMGELSLAEVGKQSGLLRSTNHQSGLLTEPVFQDAPADDSFFVTLRHQGPEAVVWFSRVRFSREAITSALEPHRGDRDVRLVSIPPQEAATEKSASRSRVSEPVDQSTSNWWARTYAAVAPLATPGWVVNLKRTVPISLAYYLLMAVGGILVVVAGILCFRTPNGAQTLPEPVDAPEAQALPVVLHPQEEEVPLPRDEPSDHAVIVEEANADASDPVLTQGDTCAQENDEFCADVAWSSWTTEEGVEPASDAASLKELPCDPYCRAEAACQAEDFVEEPDALTAPRDREVEASLVASDSVLSETPEPMSEESMVLDDREDDQFVIVGEPILQDAIPETLEVSWTEPLPEAASAPAKQSGIRIINPWC